MLALTWQLISYIYTGEPVVRPQTLKRIGGSIAAVLPKSMLDRFQPDGSGVVNVMETAMGS